MYFGKITGVWLVFLLLLGGCEQRLVSPQERFQVTGTLAVQTVNQEGRPISAPVTFKIFDFTTKTEGSPTSQDSLTLLSDEQGMIEFSRTVALAENEYFCLISDVDAELYESINYWTAYFHASDAPAKRMEVQMTVITKP